MIKDGSFAGPSFFRYICGIYGEKLDRACLRHFDWLSDRVKTGFTHFRWILPACGGGENHASEVQLRHRPDSAV